MPAPRKSFPCENTVADLSVVGRLPAGLDGRYVRIGPNPLPTRDSRPRHAFEGEGMVHGVRLRDGRAEWYRNRWVRTSRVSRRLGERPVPGPRHGLSDNANGNLVAHAGRLLALGDAGVLPVCLDDELESVSTTDFDGTLPNGFTAHPQTDPVTGEMFAAAYYHELSGPQYLVVDVEGRVRRCEALAVDGMPMMHALSLTDRHVLCYDLPVVFDPALAAAGSRCPYTWRDGRPARLGVLPREGRGADVRWFGVDPCYVFHPLNASEDGDLLTVEVIRYERVFDRSPLRPDESVPTLWRWTIDLVAGVTKEEQLDDVAEEFPRIDDRCRTGHYRYAYTVGLTAGSGSLFGGRRLRKRDLLRGTVEEHDFGPGREAGEPVFVPRDPRSAEDEGWLLSLVRDHRSGCAELVVLDADDFRAGPRARVRLPAPVSSGAHGDWFPARRCGAGQ